MDLIHKPNNIVVDVENRLMQINWADGHTSVYEFTALRRACPCAECRPWVHGVGTVGDSPESVRTAIGVLNSVKDVTTVGGYAINFRWADGHNSGIYSFEYLRSICARGEETTERPGGDDR